MLSFQTLDVYRLSVRHMARAYALASRVPPAHGDLADQLRRAALSVQLNIAEGNGKFGRDGIRHYTIARGSVVECAALLDALEALELATETELQEPREWQERVVAMLTRMRQRAPAAS